MRNCSRYTVLYIGRNANEEDLWAGEGKILNGKGEIYEKKIYERLRERFK